MLQQSHIPAIRNRRSIVYNSPHPSMCPAKVRSHGDISGRSLCPYHFVPNVDPDRIPVTLAEARCNCSSCVGQLHGDPKYGCFGQYHSVRVLKRKGCVGGTYEYVQECIAIRFGCTCAHQNIRTSAPQTTRTSVRTMSITSTTTQDPLAGIIYEG